ncbi:hypothetical protein BH09BAC2_BH09BAC2_23170 [soil metagenome]
MQNKPTDDHDQLPSDKATKDKIDKHLSDINDTISEEDMENINTGTGRENEPLPIHEKEDKIVTEDEEGDVEKPKKEMPTVWDIES